MGPCAFLREMASEHFPAKNIKFYELLRLEPEAISQKKVQVSVQIFAVPTVLYFR